MHAEEFMKISNKIENVKEKELPYERVTENF